MNDGRTLHAPLYVAIARTVAWNPPTPELQADKDARLRYYDRNHLLSGSGFDAGTDVDDRSTGNKLILTFSYHHMNDGGMYCGWSSWEATIAPSLQFGFDIKLKCTDWRNLTHELRELADSNFRDYVVECLQYALSQEVDLYPEV